MRLILLVLTLTGAIASPAVGQPAPFTFPRSTPEAQGVSSAAIQRFVEAAGEQVGYIHSFMLVRHGKVVAEGWWSPFAADEPHVLFSLSKSFTSTAVGFAVAEGRLSVNDSVLGFFPDLAPANPSANLQAMKVRDLLTMSTGHHEDAIASFPFFSDEDPVKAFLALPVAHKPGTLFVYNTPASYVLSAIVQKVTGQPVVDYLGPRLFDPLGIRRPMWEASRQGVSLGGFGLNLRTEDIARFAQLYLQKGQWQGKPLLPEAWVAEATARQMSNGSSTTSDWEQGYGYQFWRCRHGFYRGDGAFGQFAIVMPQYDAVLAITSGTRDMGLVMNLAWDLLVPGFKASALSADAAADRKLKAELASLTIPPQTGEVAPDASASIVGKRFEFVPNAQGMEALTVDAIDAKGVANLTVRIGGSDQRLTVAPGEWRKGSLDLGPRPVSGGSPTAVAASGAWTSADTYTLKIVQYRTPFAATYRLRFAGNQLNVECEQNVAFGERVSAWVGRAAGTAPASME
jgi:CubicO group peptidase (beta-lactamase class C family)